ncbi:iron ABC transporter permease [Pokkaliibacter sp. MBI-7]|uniref:ABC transporter permease n=1 Tax=Pokkaliibacter sp. MBI-7 TaxID=3040600 RepID=UPI00244A9574|nr:iron ABC transporter permease [Pokkaliibacter sp. MBI-7]MDH2433116.1 iron ABC transporter permease [Pokkaliibacter sp. MBI-7]
MFELVLSQWQTQRSRWLAPALLWLAIALLVVIVGLPVLAILLYALFPHINEWSLAEPFSALLPTLADKQLLSATVNSLRLSAAITLLSCLLALPLACQRNRMSDRSGRWWDALLMVPFLIPPYIGSMAWMQLLQVKGFSEQLLGFNLAPYLYSFPGIVSVMALHLFPMIYFAASNALRVVGHRYGDVARVFGARPWQIFSRIYLPLVLPSLVSSCLIVFILSIEEFGTPEILGNRFGFHVIVTAIHDKFSDWPIDLPGASVLSLILIVIALAAYLLQRYISERFSANLDQQVINPPPLRRSLLARTLTQLLFIVVAVLAVVLPLLSISLSALMNTLSGGLHWNNLSLQPLLRLFDGDGDAWAAISTSLSLALMAACCTVLIALLVAFAVVRLRARATVLLDFLSILPNAIPGMAIAVGLILTWNQRFWPLTPYNTSLILLLAYVCLMLPYPIRMLSAALRQLPRSLDDAAYISGASELTVIFRILAPLLAPVALAAGFIVFAISTRELVSSIMLAPPGVETVATYVFHQFDQGSINAGMAMSLVTILVSGSIIVCGQRLQGRVRP